MTMTDPVADLLTRIRNAHLSKHDRIDMPASKLKIEICKLLEKQGYVEKIQLFEEGPTRKSLRIFLKYTEQGLPVIRRIQRVSKPGRRVYKRADDIRPVLNGLGVGIVSTSQGLMTDAQARERRVGGEVLCEIW